MKRFIPSWVLPCFELCFTSTAHHVMDELTWSSAGSSGRCSRRSLASLVVYDADEEPIVPAEPHILPTPTDVPVPAPDDVPSPKPRPVP